MQITLSGLGKRFHSDWIFRGMNLQLQSGESYAILGPNGSGKSTFLQVLSGHLTPTEGKMVYQMQGKAIDADDLYKQVAIAAPYLELIEEFTLLELIEFHRQFKPLLPGMQPKDLIGLLGLEKSAHKFISNFSSGMRQRVKLGLAIHTQAPVLLLDEPATNLDAAGIAWYQQQVQQLKEYRIVVVCSNAEAEYGFCRNRINIQDYQKKNHR